MLRSVILALAFGGLLAVQASAAPLWGTFSQVSLGDMFPSGGQNNFSFDEDGPRDPVSDEPIGGAVLSHALIDDSQLLDSRGTGPWNRGVAEASAALQFGATAAPASLHARAVLTGNISSQSGVSDASAFATTFSSDSFQYIGAAATQLSLTITLTGSVDNSPADPTFQTGVFAGVSVFPSAGYVFTTDHDALVFGLGVTPKAEDFVNTLVITTGNGALQTRTVTLTFDVAPGEVFHVWQSLAAWAAGDDRFSDAYSTMTSSFDQPHLVQSLAVPEPASALLLVAGGALGFAALGRKRRRRA